MLSNVLTERIHELRKNQRTVNVHGLTWHGSIARLRDIRADFHWKLAHQLTDEYDEIRLEDLNLQGMKALWGRKVSDLGFADFVKKLVYVAQKKGVKITIH